MFPGHREKGRWVPNLTEEIKRKSILVEKTLVEKTSLSSATSGSGTLLPSKLNERDLTEKVFTFF